MADTVKATIIWEETQRKRSVGIEIPREVYEGKGDELQVWLVAQLDDEAIAGRSIGFGGECDRIVHLRDAYVTEGGAE